MADGYSLQELASASGIEPRTIRSYIERDLLPGPDRLGPNASYGPEHLARLRVITRLRDARSDLRLDEIRALLAQLSAEQIAALAAGELKLAEVLEPGWRSSSASALGYLERLDRSDRHNRSSVAESPITASYSRMDSSPSHHGPSSRPVTSAPPESGTRFEELLATLELLLEDGRVARSVRAQPWHRIPITPEVELSVRGDFTPDQLAVLQRIGDHLRHLLLKGARS